MWSGLFVWNYWQSSVRTGFFIQTPEKSSYFCLVMQFTAQISLLHLHKTRDCCVLTLNKRSCSAWAILASVLPSQILASSYSQLRGIKSNSPWCNVAFVVTSCCSQKNIGVLSFRNNFMRNPNWMTSRLFLSFSFMHPSLILKLSTNPHEWSDFKTWKSFLNVLLLKTHAF